MSSPPSAVLFSAPSTNASALHALLLAAPGALCSLRLNQQGQPYLDFGLSNLEPLMGWPLSSLQGPQGNFWQCIHPEDAKWMLGQLRAGLEHGRPGRLRFHAIGRDGRLHSLQAHFSSSYEAATGPRWQLWLIDDPCEHCGHPTAFALQAQLGTQASLGKLQDAQRDELEALIILRTRELAEAKEAAEAANRSKTSFLTHMSHEIRTPLNAIIGLAHLARRSAHDPELITRLDAILSAADHLLDLINDILDLSKIEADKLELSNEQLDPHRLAEEVIALLAPRAREKGLRLRYEPSTLPDGQIYGDPTRIRQALLNYAANAVKFTTRGHVTLRIRPQEWQGNKVLLRFEVEDSGCGIPSSQLKHLFKPFEQVRKQAQRSTGTGLGLAITRHLARLMGGEVGVESQEGRGSLFWFTARLTIQQQQTRTHPHQDNTEICDAERLLSARRPVPKLLLVEDNPVNRQLTADLLQSIGLQVDLASDGEEAIRLVHSRPYDLVLMDIQMPGMDGITATRRLRAQPAYAKLPIIAMTASAFDEDRRACLEAGMNDHVGKPFAPETLFQALLRWLPAPDQPPSPQLSQTTVSKPATTDSTISTLVFAQIPGLDASLGLRSVGGQVQQYRTLLDEFLKIGAQDLENLDTQLGSANWEQAARRAHSLKGASGLLGLSVVHELAARIELSLRSGEYKDELLNDDLRALHQAFADFRQHWLGLRASLTP